MPEFINLMMLDIGRRRENIRPVLNIDWVAISSPNPYSNHGQQISAKGMIQHFKKVLL